MTTELLSHAAQLHQAGRLSQAIAAYRQVLTTAPDDAVANHNLAIALMQTRAALAEALPHFATAWAAAPGHHQHWLSYLRALVLGGEMSTAQRVLADGVSRGLPPIKLELFAPGAAERTTAPQRLATRASPQALRQIEILHAQGQLAQAEARASELASAHPSDPEAQRALGVLRIKLGRDSEAISALEIALQAAPQDLVLLRTLAEATLRVGLLPAAERWFRRGLASSPDPRIWGIGLARTLIALGRNDDAMQRLRALQARFPDDAEVASALGLACRDVGDDVQAIAWLERALAGGCETAAVHSALGALYCASKQFSRAEQLCRDALAKDPNQSDARIDLAMLQIGRGDIAQGLANLARARPDEAGRALEVRSARLFCENYLAEAVDARIIRLAREFGALCSDRARPFTHQNRFANPDCLSIGLVSGDLHSHPVAFFLESVLEATDRTRTQWTLYTTTAFADDVTSRLRKLSDHWVDLTGMDDAAAARVVHERQHHILLDLSGHTFGNRLSMFAWRPAPLQGSWLGYFATTGVSEIDFLLADPVMAPAGTSGEFTERIAHLATRLCFTPPGSALPPGPPPVLTKGYVTFGCYQAMAKISASTLRLWSSVLAAVPGSRLRLQCQQLHDESSRNELLTRMRAADISTARVELCPGTSREAYFETYRDVDVLLDTTPYPGGTTTCEALWMGVPTVTLRGNTMIARQGASLLTAAGLADWIAETEAEYVAIACSKVAAVNELAVLRDSLRERLLGSALLDNQAFARDLEQVLFALWREYAGRQEHPAATSQPGR